MSSASSSAFFTTSDEAISRAALDELLSNDQVLHRFEHCVFDDEDLERVYMRGVFKGSTISSEQAAALVAALGVNVI